MFISEKTNSYWMETCSKKRYWSFKQEHYWCLKKTTWEKNIGRVCEGQRRKSSSVKRGIWKDKTRKKQSGQS